MGVESRGFPATFDDVVHLAAHPDTRAQGGRRTWLPHELYVDGADLVDQDGELRIPRQLTPSRPPDARGPAVPSALPSGTQATRLAPPARERLRTPQRQERCPQSGICRWAGQPALADRAPSRGRVSLADCFVPTMHRATPGTRTLPSFSNAPTFAIAVARIRSRAGSSTC